MSGDKDLDKVDRLKDVAMATAEHRPEAVGNLLLACMAILTEDLTIPEAATQLDSYVDSLKRGMRDAVN